MPHMFLERAEEFYQAFRDLPPTPPPSWPRYFMLCHAIELALKAYLSARGKSTSSLKKFGHDLRTLLSSAASAGLPLGVLSYSEIELLDEAHRNFWARYPKEDGKPVFVIDQFEPYAVELLRHVARFMRGENYKLRVDY